MKIGKILLGVGAVLGGLALLIFGEDNDDSTDTTCDDTCNDPDNDYENGCDYDEDDDEGDYYYDYDEDDDEGDYYYDYDEDDEDAYDSIYDYRYDKIRDCYYNIYDSTKIYSNIDEKYWECRLFDTTGLFDDEQYVEDDY